MFTTMISTEELSHHLEQPDWVVIDCRFSLTATERGRQDYLQAHVPGALYAHLDEDLSGPVITSKTGRHPLPAVAALVETFSNWGIESGIQVVVYDDSGGSIAARLWWLLQWLGHAAVAVLDGGWPRWQAGRYAQESGRTPAVPARRQFEPRVRPEFLVDADQVDAMRLDARFRLLDARSADRFRGENETLDSIAGHIPGAISAPYPDNLNSGKSFLSPQELKERYQKLLGDIPTENAVVYCGSGVTAAHNVLAMAYAGLGIARLYAGSWSEWITDPKRLLATGGSGEDEQVT